MKSTWTWYSNYEIRNLDICGDYLLKVTTKKRIDIAHRKNACADDVKFLIEDLLLSIKINEWVLSVQHVHDHTKK